MLSTNHSGIRFLRQHERRHLQVKSLTAQVSHDLCDVLSGQTPLGIEYLAHDVGWLISQQLQCLRH